jgi:hypothetical protein
MIVASESNENGASQVGGASHRIGLSAAESDYTGATRILLNLALDTRFRKPIVP